MISVKFTVNGQRLKRITTPFLVADSKNYVLLDFQFMGSAWDGCIKTAVFKTGDENTGSKMLTGNSVIVPTDCLVGDSFEVSIFGENREKDKRITTNPLKVELCRSGYAEAEEFTEPLPSVYEQILDKIDEMGEIDPETVGKAVKEHLENNPISSDEITYENPHLANQAGTVTAALNEAINFVVGNLPDLVAKKHSHTNKESVLDKLADNNGKLTYNGEEIGSGSGGVVERPTESIVFSSGEFQAYPHNDTTTSILVWEKIIPVGTEIKTIKIKYNDSWIDIHELNIVDTVPFALNMHKCYVDEMDTGGYVLAVIGSIGGWGSVITALQVGEAEEIEVVYYSEGGVE